MESPAKAKTISKFLGKDFEVKASMGHIRDLPKSTMGIDIENDFEPTYAIPFEKKKTITELKGYINKDTTIWIATDEDREGEAIGWHLLEALDVKKKKNEVHRIVFHEITKSAIQGSIKQPREINLDLVDAQQARRILDRLVGYELSPLLWKKVMAGLSAGRVQSVAVRLIVDREREIEAFKPEEFWKIKGIFNTSKKEQFEGLLELHKDKKIKPTSEKETNKILDALKNDKYIIDKVKDKNVKKSPSAPFITSTLQQEASRHLHYSVKKTMVIAQQLYEGVKVKSGLTGLITYMRTDSFSLAAEAVKEAKSVIQSTYGKEYVSTTTREYKKKKGAQEAHEAIRPTHFNLKPEDVKEFLTSDQFRLYELIWKRAIATQMQDAKLHQLVVDVKAEASEYVFRAYGQTVEFPGFMKAYVEKTDNPEDDTKQYKEKLLPLLKEKDKVDAKEIDPTQHFTKPPARYTEASLVKKLESEGIGRPSTYAPTISTIVTRKYIEKEQKHLLPTDLGKLVTDLLVEHFADIVNYQFTAEMEEGLDKVAEGKQKWVPLIREFYTPFHKLIEEKTKSLKKSDITTEESDEICEKCGEKMVIKFGKYGKFLACSGFPKCKNTKPLEGEENGKKEPDVDPELRKKLERKKCDKCGNPMEVKQGRYGAFLGCSNYPKCKNMQPIVKLTGIKCPECGKGQIVERRSKRGRIFYGCNQYPKCKKALWDKPIDKKCEKCGAIMVEKNDKELCSERCDKPKKEKK